MAARLVLVLVLAATALAFSACGGDSEESSTEGEAGATPEVAIEEIAAVRSGLAATLAAYERGDADEAEQLAGDAYLEHFEIVEGPLEEVEPELNETLEELIREELREAIVAGDPVAKVQVLIEEADAGLDEATSALQGSAGQ